MLIGQYVILKACWAQHPMGCCCYTHLAISDMLSICLTSKCGLDFTIQIVLWDTTFKSNQCINVHKECCNYIPSFTKSN